MKSKKRISKLLVASLLSYGLSQGSFNNFNVVSAAERVVNGIKVDDINLFKTKSAKRKLECEICNEKLLTIFSKNANPARPDRVVMGKVIPDTILLAKDEVICERCRHVFHEHCWDFAHRDADGNIIDHADRCPNCRFEKPKEELTKGEIANDKLAEFWDYISLYTANPLIFKLPWPDAPLAVDLRPPAKRRGIDVELDFGGRDRKKALEDAEAKKKKKEEEKKILAEIERGAREKAEAERREEENAKLRNTSSPTPTVSTTNFSAAPSLAAMTALTTLPTMSLSNVATPSISATTSAVQTTTVNATNAPAAPVATNNINNAGTPSGNINGVTPSGVNTSMGNQNVATPNGTTSQVTSSHDMKPGSYGLNNDKISNLDISNTEIPVR
jgi:hypothetical protein